MGRSTFSVCKTEMGQGPVRGPPGRSGQLAAVPVLRTRQQPQPDESARAGPIGPAPASRTAAAPRLPGQTGAAHVTQGPAPGSCALTPRHPTPGPASIGCGGPRAGPVWLGTLTPRVSSAGSEPARLCFCPQPRKNRRQQRWRVLDRSLHLLLPQFRHL
jgi:hypothetical protein